MPKEIVCPSCGNRGEATIDEKGAFEVRGQFQGKAVRKCNKCGAGFFLGIFSGILFGKPKVIPSDHWKLMEETWEREFGTNSRKETVPLSQVAKDFAEFIISWSSTQEIDKIFGELLQDESRPRNGDHMRREWLILNMFAVTVGLSKSIVGKTITDQLLGDVHYLINQTEFSNDNDRVAFEGIVQKRYASYYDILNDKSGDIAFKLGKFFAEKSIGTTDILIILASSELFFTHVKFTKEFIENASVKFDLVR